MIRIRSEKERMKELADNIIKGVSSDDVDVEINPDDLLFIVSKAYEHVVGEGLDTQNQNTGGQSSMGASMSSAGAKHNQGSRQQQNAAPASSKPSQGYNNNRNQQQTNYSQNYQNNNAQQNRQDNPYKAKRDQELENVKQGVKEKKQGQQNNDDAKFFEGIPEPDDIGNSANHPDFSDV